MTDFKKTTPWIATDKGMTVTRFTYGFTCLQGNPGPYFSITGEEWARKRSAKGLEPKGNDCLSCGCLHESKGMPEFLKPALPFHLFDPETGPMHYEANALYFLELASGERPPAQYGAEPIAAFKSTVAWGALADDTNEGWLFENLRRVGVETRKAWLADRLVELKVRFLEVIQALDMLDHLHAAEQWHSAREGEAAARRESYTKRDG